MPIRHNNWSPGVQSLALIPEGSEKSLFSVGIMYAGERKEFTHTRSEVISVTSGEIIINGLLTIPQDGGYTYPPGGIIIMEAKVHSSFLCQFPEEEGASPESG